MRQLPLVESATRHTSRTALLAPDGRWAYRDLLAASASCAAALLDGRPDLGEARVAFLVPPGTHHVATQWGIWRAGGIAVPLCMQHPAPELEYVVDDADAQVLVAHPDVADRLRPIAGPRGLHLHLTSEMLEAEAGPVPEVDPSRRAMIVYTSGTTSRPKGVVSTHAGIAAQIRSLVEAWAWSPDDHILHVLPLHHIHGIVNVLCCALWSGATCEILPGFSADAVWDRLAAADGPNLFMAVPTIYNRLIAHWESLPAPQREALGRSCARLRLMVSGSAALPVPVLEKWRSISGHTLLERYGMTEIGMGLSNPLHGERRPGAVGVPLPGVRIRLRGEDGGPVAQGQPGEIQVKGPTVFGEYWRRPEATADAFTEDGWFRTGDIALLEDGAYRILGRNSVDIIKTGGYKVSALEIEDVLRTHETVDECAVVGVDDEEWGQRVAAAVVVKEGRKLDLETLRAWGRERLAPYKVPSLLEVVDRLPRNPMGKVTKPDVVKLFGKPAQQA